MRAIAKVVHSSFRRVERAADWLTGSAGPVFIAICITLVVGGVWTFFSSMFLEIAPIPTELANLFHTYSPAHIALGLIPTLFDSLTKDSIATLRFFFWLILCLFTVYSIGWHYYLACTVPPGSVCEGLGDAVPERRTGPGSNIWWARYRTRAAKASGPKVHDLHSAKGHVMTHEPPEAAAPVRVSSVADLKKLNKALDGLDSNRAKSASVTPSRSSSDRMPPTVNASLAQSHQSSSSSERGTPRMIPKSDLPLSVRDLNPVLASPMSFELEPSSNPLFPPRPRPSHDSVRAANVTAAAAEEEDLYTGESEIDEDDQDLFPLAGMCRKCPTIPLSKALSVLPPELRKIEKQIRKNAPSQTFSSKLSSEDIDEGEAEVRAWLGESAAEKLVAPPKPERAHHCRVCKTCTLKFDHHCPWLNQCVGLGNERYFVLFMSWLSFGCGIVVYSGFGVMRRSLSWSADWPYLYTPRVLVMLLFILALVMGLALFVMAGWQVNLVGRGETSVESQDHAHYRDLAKKRGQEFVNVYDIGWRRNLELFFNVGPGSPYGWHTILLPMRVPPYSDGWHFAKRRGFSGKHAGIDIQEQLTDEEFDDDHYDAVPASHSSAKTGQKLASSSSK
ncbi:hypothetical protein NDA10_005338 [Ustilago hordei]|nr:hypothetical protein NDA10_005338 [Ustilago hordei]